METKIPVEVSARHCHLAKEELEKLFGKDYELKKIKQLSQPSDFACEETVSIKAGEKTLENVRIVGPLREKTQVEISLSDSLYLGIKPEIRLSGDLQGTSGIVIFGPAGSVELTEGLIVAKRHIHCATTEAKELGLKDNDIVSVKIEGERGLVFDNVVVRIKDEYKLCLHLDTDEGNACGINKVGEGTIK